MGVQATKLPVAEICFSHLGLKHGRLGVSFPFHLVNNILKNNKKKTPLLVVKGVYYYYIVFTCLPGVLTKLGHQAYHASRSKNALFGFWRLWRRVVWGDPRFDLAIFAAYISIPLQLIFVATRKVTAIDFRTADAAGRGGSLDAESWQPGAKGIHGI